MLQTRLVIGSVLAVLGLGVLIADEYLAPWYPGWFLLVLALGLASCIELFWLVGQSYKFASWLCFVGVVVLLSMNWLARVPIPWWPRLDLWTCILIAFIAYFFSLFLVEMAYYRQPGEVMIRMSLSLWMVAYLGLLPCFLVQLRWHGYVAGDSTYDPRLGTVALLLAIFVPKCCDIGAYFTGRWFGRNRMSPVISPKKTWEGALGGLCFAALITVIIDNASPVSLLHQNLWAEIGFGVTVGGAGILGDLAESMIKRDCNTKDASAVLPGFGGVLDVIDAVLFAAPVAYLWLVLFDSSL
jgi:phosphatidate cytidylyltransferase